MADPLMQYISQVWSICNNYSSTLSSLCLNCAIVYTAMRAQRRYEIVNILHDFCAYQCVSLWACPHTVAALKLKIYIHPLPIKSLSHSSPGFCKSEVVRDLF